MGFPFGTSALELADGDHWLSPAGLLAELDVQPGTSVGEIGAGSAVYTFPLGYRVGSEGRVFAVEWRPTMIEDLRSRLAAPTAPDSVQLAVGRPVGTHLEPACCDLVIVADMWHRFKDHERVLDEVRRILRPQGHLAVLNWRPDGLCPPGPPLEQRISMRDAICAMEMKSWGLVKADAIGRDGYLVIAHMTDESVQS